MLEEHQILRPLHIVEKAHERLEVPHRSPGSVEVHRCVDRSQARLFADLPDPTALQLPPHVRGLEERRQSIEVVEDAAGGRCERADELQAHAPRHDHHLVGGLNRVLGPLPGGLQRTVEALHLEVREIEVKDVAEGQCRAPWLWRWPGLAGVVRDLRVRRGDTLRAILRGSVRCPPRLTAI